jgi:hypothetical protein
MTFSVAIQDDLKDQLISWALSSIQGDVPHLLLFLLPSRLFDKEGSYAMIGSYLTIHDGELILSLGGI